MLQTTVRINAPPLLSTCRNSGFMRDVLAIHRQTGLASINMDDSNKDPSVVLPYLVGRPLTATEVYEAFGYRKSAYYKAAHEGRLITADNLIRVADYFGLNPVELQVRYGLISPEAVATYVESDPGLPRLRDLQPDASKPPI